MSLATGFVGRRSLRASLDLVDPVVFVLHALRDARGRGLLNRAGYNAILTQIIFTFVDALPATRLLAVSSPASAPDPPAGSARPVAPGR